MQVRKLVSLVQQELRARADPAKAGPMAAYMRTGMPFYGVQKPGRAEVVRLMKAEFVPRNLDEYREGVLALWNLPHREEKYLAITLARMFPRFLGPDALPLYEQVIREGAWWDLVDEPAIHLVGKVWLAHRSELTPTLDAWVDDPDLWIRRTAILAQIAHKSATDADRLFRYCSRRAGEKEFFIRKAIGWALREYARISPPAVADFLERHRPELSGLSYREAAKGLIRSGAARPGRKAV